MRMFESLLSSIPKNRSTFVNELDLPDDITVSPYWTEPDSLTVRSDSILSTTTEDEVNTISTDSSIPLSRAMTDSEIDYELYRRYKNRSFSDPWLEMKAANDAFPPKYLTSLYSFQNSSLNTVESAMERVHRYNEELKLKMERFFNDECRVFTPDDPSLLTLEKALHNVDLKYLDSDLDSITP
ncbi:uncharacterized protein LOC113520697 [Galleria mellonella]|uniref:Uncharacterized protein LOC113520697 n=1 Tax=Galleria mellonella TaxID=7137 RepID=A0A6J1WZK9_GALME|nr:uncharacterized protein LOC113520697 [Galleria mellonella]XP_052753233.1 uncharacterized protein LOC113520697 [Galleria mellonella]